MSTGHVGKRIKLLMGVLPGLAIFVAYPCTRWRNRMMPRRDPSRPFHDLYLVTADGIGVTARVIAGGESGAVIVAHPAVTGQRYAPLVELAEKLSSNFDVYTFDFRGHGRSGGRLEMDMRGPVEDLRAVIEHVREAGHGWIGVIGFSLGGMASFLYASQDGGVDAVAVVGAPPSLPNIEPFRRWLPAWSLFLRFLGARFKAAGGGGPVPSDVADRFPDIPLLVIHGELEAFYARDDLDRMLEKLGGRGELWVIEGAGHTELAGRKDDLVQWMVDKAALDGRSKDSGPLSGSR